MRVKNKLFPYPVLNSNSRFSNFPAGEFKLVYNQEETEENTTILKDAHIQINCVELQELYNLGDILFTCIIECSDTIFRKAIPLKPGESINITLDHNDFNKAVVVSAFAYAAKNFTYMFKTAAEDYQNISFEMEKYDILAADDGAIIVISHPENEKDVKHSIFSIINVHSQTDGSYQTSYDCGSKIEILLSDKDYGIYSALSNCIEYEKTNFNIFLIPVLTEAFAKCQELLAEKGNNDLDDITGQYLWFKSVIKSYQAQTGKDLTKEVFEKVSPVVFAQTILGNPLSSSLHELTNALDKGTIETDK
jgi:hypothetical protein